MVVRIQRLQDGEVTAHLERGGTVLILLEEFYAQDVVKNAHPALHEFDSNLNKPVTMHTRSTCPNALDHIDTDTRPRLPAFPPSFTKHETKTLTQQCSARQGAVLIWLCFLC